MGCPTAPFKRNWIPRRRQLCAGGFALSANVPRSAGDPTSRPEAVNDHTGASGESPGNESAEAQGRLYPLVVPQVGQRTKYQQGHSATDLAQSRAEAPSVGAVHGQR